MKALAEAHDFGVGLALRVEVGAALAAAHRQAGQRVLEYLLKAEELDDAQVDGRMEAKTALVGADCGVELHAVAAVDLHLALIVGPCDAELHHAFRLDDAFEHARFLIFRMLRDHRFEAFENLANGLQELRLVAVALFHLRVHALDVLVSEHILPLRDSWLPIDGLILCVRIWTAQDLVQDLETLFYERWFRTCFFLRDCHALR